MNANNLTNQEVEIVLYWLDLIDIIRQDNKNNLSYVQNKIEERFGNTIFTFLTDNPELLVELYKYCSTYLKNKIKKTEKIWNW